MLYSPPRARALARRRWLKAVESRGRTSTFGDARECRSTKLSSDPGTQPFQTRVDSWNDLRREFGGLFSMGSRARARDASLNSASLQSVSVRITIGVTSRW